MSREVQAQERFVSALRAALPGVEIATESRIGESRIGEGYLADISYRVDITIPQARVVIEIKRRPDPQVLRQAQDQMVRLARIGWAGIVVFADETALDADETALGDVVRQIEEWL